MAKDEVPAKRSNSAKRGLASNVWRGSNEDVTTPADAALATPAKKTKSAAKEAPAPKEEKAKADSAGLKKPKVKKTDDPPEHQPKTEKPKKKVVKKKGSKESLETVGSWMEGAD